MSSGRVRMRPWHPNHITTMYSVLSFCSTDDDMQRQDPGMLDLSLTNPDARPSTPPLRGAPKVMKACAGIAGQGHQEEKKEATINH